jgi:hypothetical protein
LVGGRPLREYYNWELTIPVNKPGGSWIFWRDSSATHYRLYKPSDNPWALGRLYVDGTDQIDLPDFHSIDISVPVLGWIGMTGNGIADRFGNVYWALSMGMSPASVDMGVSYSEGYVCPNIYSSDCFTRYPSLVDATPIRNTIEGFCASLGVGAGIGATVVECASGGMALVYSIGFII